jgi:hypothetical protein
LRAAPRRPRLTGLRHLRPDPMPDLATLRRILCTNRTIAVVGQ